MTTTTYSRTDGATITDLWRMSALEVAEAIRTKQTSSREVIEAHLRRIDEVNPSINAVVVVLGEQALEAAKAADRVVAGGGDLLPFHGCRLRSKRASISPVPQPPWG
jgi:amidase